MKKYLLPLICLFGICSIMSKCEKDQDCINCLVDGIVSRTVVFDTVKGGKVTIYPVFTPSNHPMCDSMAWSPVMGAYVYPQMVHSYQKLCTVQEARDSLLAGNDTACPCRQNPDSAFNDDINSFFYIGGIEKYEFNRLIIKAKGDTTVLREYDDYDNVNNLFIGEVAMNMDLGYYEYNNTKPLTSGVYSFDLVIYKEEQHATQVGDTVSGNFAIIRSDKVMNVKCASAAHDKNDPLLKD